MTPHLLPIVLRRVADAIDNSERPSRARVANVLQGILLQLGAESCGVTAGRDPSTHKDTIKGKVSSPPPEGWQWKQLVADLHAENVKTTVSDGVVSFTYPDDLTVKKNDPDEIYEAAFAPTSGWMNNDAHLQKKYGKDVADYAISLMNEIH